MRRLHVLKWHFFINGCSSSSEDPQRCAFLPAGKVREAVIPFHLLCPLGVQAHSTRGVERSYAQVNAAFLTDIWKVAVWATPNTVAKFYNVQVQPVLPQVLSGMNR